MKFLFAAISVTAISYAAAQPADLILESSAPANRWEDALIGGNGRQGVMVFGKPREETIVLNHEKCWVPGQDVRPDVPDMAHRIPEVRELAKQGDFKEAGDILFAAFGEENAKMHPPKEFRRFNGAQSPRFGYNYVHPAAHLVVQAPDAGKITDYGRSVNLSTGEITVRWKDDRGTWERRSFVSRPDNVVVLEIRNTSGSEIDCDVALRTIPGFNSKEIAAAEVTHGAKGAFFHTRYENRHGQTHREGYQIYMRASHDGGTLEAAGDHLAIRDAGRVLLLLRTDFLSNHDARSQETVAADLSALGTDYDALLSSHANVHRELFNRVSLQFRSDGTRVIKAEKLIRNARDSGPTPEFLEALFSVGRYAFISSCGELPPTLMGLWGNTWKPAWWGHYTNDSNLNLAVSQGNTGNLPEMMESYFSWIESLYPSWRRNAERLYGARGYMGAIGHGWRHGIAIGGWHEWTGSAGWLSAYFIEHYQVTGDETFLRERVVPLLANVTVFYEDFLKGTEGPDGKYFIYPSISPENAPLNTQGKNRARTAPNSSSEIAIISQTLRTLIQAYQLLEVHHDRIPELQAMLGKLPEYRINSAGALAEWSFPGIQDNYKHRHNSHLYAVYPGVDIHRGTPKLYQASKVAMRKRIEAGRGDFSAHGVMHQGFFGARLEDPELAWSALDAFSRKRFLYSSFISSHNPNHRTYNLDSTFSLPAILTEMCLYSRPGVLNLLPGMPLDKLPTGTLNGLLARQAMLVDELSWDAADKRIALTVTSSIDQTIEVQCRLPVKDISGGAVKKDGRWMLRLGEGETVSLIVKLD